MKKLQAGIKRAQAAPASWTGSPTGVAQVRGREQIIVYHVQ